MRTILLSLFLIGCGGPNSYHPKARMLLDYQGYKTAYSTRGGSCFRAEKSACGVNLSDCLDADVESIQCAQNVREIQIEGWR